MKSRIIIFVFLKKNLYLNFLKYLENENNYKNKNLEPLYIKGHYAEK